MVNKLLRWSVTEFPKSVRYLPKKNKNIYPHKDSYTTAHKGKGNREKLPIYQNILYVQME